MVTREEALAQAQAEVAQAQDRRIQAIAEAERELQEAQQRLDAAKAMKSSIWPKRKSILVGNYGDCGEDLLDWAIEECGFAENGIEYRELSGILYEAEVVFDIFEDGTYKLVGFWYPNGRREGIQGFGEKGEVKW